MCHKVLLGKCPLSRPLSLGSPSSNGRLSAIRAPRAQKVTLDLTREKHEKIVSTIKRDIYFIYAALNSKQLFFSVCSIQLKETYDASKEASNQQLYVRMLGSSIKLSLLSRQTSKVRHKKIHVLKTPYNCNKIEQKRPFWPVFDPCWTYSTRHSLWTANRNEAKKVI